jgi:tetratricopeptide (TPR) repeat protein
MQKEMLKEAAEAFSRVVQLNQVRPLSLLNAFYFAWCLLFFPPTHATSRFAPQESFEAWANLGGVYMRLRQWPQAFCALDEAIKLSRSNWKLWQNYFYTALSSDHVTAAIDAAENLLELQVWRHIIHTPFLFYFLIHAHCSQPGQGRH